MGGRARGGRGDCRGPSPPPSSLRASPRRSGRKSSPRPGTSSSVPPLRRITWPRTSRLRASSVNPSSVRKASVKPPRSRVPLGAMRRSSHPSSSTTDSVTWRRWRGGRDRRGKVVEWGGWGKGGGMVRFGCCAARGQGGGGATKEFPQVPAAAPHARARLPSPTLRATVPMVSSVEESTKVGAATPNQGCASAALADSRSLGSYLGGRGGREGEARGFRGGGF